MALVIGYGNPLRSDDGLGVYLAEMLKHGEEVITCTQLTPELAEPMSRAEKVIFMDASMGETPGEVTVEQVEPMPTSGAFTHNVTPASLLAAAYELYSAAPQALLISITGASFEYDCNFSPVISARLPEIIKRVDELIRLFSAQNKHRTIEKIDS
jgi:hydrogenase maturation protease